MTQKLPSKPQPVIKPFVDTHNSIITRKDILLLFSSENKLASLSLLEKRSAVKHLTLSYRTSFLETEEPPHVVLQNLITLFASTDDLLELLPPDTVIVAIALITRDRYVTVPKRFKPKFLARLLSLPVGDLTRIPTPMIGSLISTVRHPGVLESLPRQATLNLITVLSMSTPLFNVLPLTTFASLVSFVSHEQIILAQMPPSTLFGFLEGFLNVLNEPSGFVVDVLPTPDLVNVLSPMITHRMLSVLPTRCLDLMLAVIGSSSKLSQAMPAINFVSIFGLLATSPRQLGSTNPSYLGGLLNTVAECPHLLNGIPSTTYTQLFEAMVAHLPMCLNYVPMEVITLLLGPVQNDTKPFTTV